MAFNRKTITKELDMANLQAHNDNYTAIKTELDAHDTHIAAQTAHGSTSAATAGKIVQRDSAGRAKMAAPAAADDIARKAEVDTVQTNLDTHEADASAHLSAADRAKFDGIQAGAEPNQSAFSQVNDVAAASESDTLTIAGGTGITVTTNPTTKTVTVTATGEATPGPHGSSHDPDGSDPIPELVALRGEFDALTAADIGAETPEGAQAKVDALAGEGNTKTVAEVAEDVADVTAQLADVTSQLGGGYIINGGFDVWQRGNTFVNANGYTADRWNVVNLVDSNVQVSKAAAIEPAFTNSLRIAQITTIGGVGSYSDVKQPIEDYKLLAGKTVTIGYKIKADVGVNYRLFVTASSGTLYDSNNISGGGTSNDHTATIVIPEGLTSLTIMVRLIRTGLDVGKGINIQRVQLKLGTSLGKYIPKTFAEELRDCQRYFEKSYNYDVAPGTATGAGFIVFQTRTAVAANANGNLYPGLIKFSTRKRLNPTVTIYAANGVKNSVRNNKTLDIRSGVTAANVGEHGIGNLVVDNTSPTAISLDDIIDFHWVADAEL